VNYLFLCCKPGMVKEVKYLLEPHSIMPISRLRDVRRYSDYDGIIIFHSAFEATKRDIAFLQSRYPEMPILIVIKISEKMMITVNISDPLGWKKRLLVEVVRLQPVTETATETAEEEVDEEMSMVSEVA